jgi:transcriptional regulator with PAS, ATPase and Fis domain
VGEKGDDGMEVNKEILESIINTAYEWSVVVDADAEIVLISDAYCEFLGVSREEAIGRPVQEIIENTRMHIIVKTGKAEIVDNIQRIKGNDMVANRFPILQNGKVIGAVGKVVFRNTKEMNALAAKVSRMSMELEFYRNELERESTAKYEFNQIIGEAFVFNEVKELAEKAAKSHSTIFITGESGTGKELFAHAIHHASLRSHKPFIKINCAAIPENLLESELFGYADGAFTGARKGGKSGKFELADQGTLFLDEIGDMPLSMQSKLLRVLQEMEVERVGGSHPIPIDVRIIAATNAKIEEAVKRGDFRQDLYYRLNIVRLDIPSLRQRKEDIPLLIQRLLEKLNQEFGHIVSEVSHEAMAVLLQHNWPGNVRELENVLERAINVVDGFKIELEHLPYYLKSKGKTKLSMAKLHLKEIMEDVEKEAIQHGLNLAGGNRYKAAELLGISKSTLYDKLKKYHNS